MTSRRLERYLTELSIENDENAFQLPWGGMLLQNCGKYGNLIKFENKKQKKRKGKQLWVYLPLQIFREDGEVFGIFRCLIPISPLSPVSPISSVGWHAAP